MALALLFKVFFIQHLAFHRWADGSGDLDLTVEQPAIIRAEFGDSVTMNCTFGIEKSHYTVIWSLDCGDLPPLESSPCYRNRVTFQSNHREITIVNVTENDSGTYCCRVEAFGGRKGIGNGTRVEVTKRQPGRDCNMGILWLSMEILHIFFLIILIILLSILIKHSL
ncbi:natural cytotoxicity triggering receptor 3-like isoform X2 [Ascaphus truei]|uniref:natural cytotoxicity triggering receptor 3-like isoform X2 n=1 Tax=Ascaphus truei TaxID=8439 RepID=UPI003F5A1C4C